MDKDAATFFKQQKQEAANNQCFDCSSGNPQWASVNNGVFLCLVCCGVHRGMGVDVSFVRSLTMDAWTESQKQMMQIGGNAKALAFFESQKIDTLPIRAKYNTVAADYYRKMLKARASGNEVSDPAPTNGSAPLIAPAPEATSGTGPDQFTPKPEGGSFSFLPSATSSWADMGLSALGSIASKAQEAAGTAISSVQQKGVVESMTEAATKSASWVGEKSRTVATTVQSEDFWKNAQQTVSQVAGTATETLGTGVVLASDWVNQKLDGNSSTNLSPADIPTQSQSASSINPQNNQVATSQNHPGSVPNLSTSSDFKGPSLQL